MSEPKYLYVARVVKPKGLTGLMLIFLLTDYPQNIKAQRVLYLFPPLEEMDTLTVSRIDT